MFTVNRRGLLERIAFLAGVATIPGMTSRALYAADVSLAPEDMLLLEAIADTIIPVTDTPGAVGAGVPGAFAKLLVNWAAPSRRVELLSAMQAMDTKARETDSGGLVSMIPAVRYELLSVYDKENAGNAAYAKLKELLVSLYYLSEIGATVELRYEHSPGVWEPSIPVTAETRNYGGAASF